MTCSQTTWRIVPLWRERFPTDLFTQVHSLCFCVSSFASFRIKDSYMFWGTRWSITHMYTCELVWWCRHDDVIQNARITFPIPRRGPAWIHARSLAGHLVFCCAAGLRHNSINIHCLWKSATATAIAQAAGQNSHSNQLFNEPVWSLKKTDCMKRMVAC